MTGSAKRITIVSSLFTLLFAGALYFMYYFLSALGVPEVTVTTDAISTNREFDNGVTIERIRVDSIGDERHPVRYTVVYTASCNLDRRIAMDAPDKIEFDKPGNYSWDEDTTQIRYIHEGMSREPLDTISQTWWLNKFGKHPVCPLKLEREQWYFIQISDPTVTGIFFYIDRNGKENQFFQPSGVSPI